MQKGWCLAQKQIPNLERSDFLANSSQGTQMKHQCASSHAGWTGHLRSCAPLPVHTEGVFWGLPRDKCPAGCPSTLRGTLGQARCGSDLSFSLGKPWVAGGCDCRTSESHSGLLCPEPGLSDPRSTHRRTGHFLWGAQSSCPQHGTGRTCAGRSELLWLVVCFWVSWSLSFHVC